MPSWVDGNKWAPVTADYSASTLACAMVYVFPSARCLSQEKGIGGNEEFVEKVNFVIFVVGIIAVVLPE